MNRQQKTPVIFKEFRNIMYKVLDALHCIISVTIVAAIVITLFSLPEQLTRCFDVESKSLITFLEYIINIIIAAELIHVLLHQSLDTIVEILTLAATREIILEKMPPTELFVGIAGIALLFAIRKFLFISHKDRETHSAPLSTSGDIVEEATDKDPDGGDATKNIKTISF